MRDLDRALSEINAIRCQMARGLEFRGYGPTTLAATGLIAGVAAAGQALWLADPTRDALAYLALWISVAALSVTIIGFEMVTRSRRVHSNLAEEMIQSAVEEFLPAAVAGLLVSVVILRFAPQSLWMLPGLWQIIFSLGLFASLRSFPRPMVAVGWWYLGSGLACLAFASGEQAFSPWAMGVPFGVGQLLIAAVLSHASRRDHG
jgi:hypothetical protein